MSTEILNIGIIFICSILFLFILVRPEIKIKKIKKTFSKHFKIEELLIAALLIICLVLSNSYNNVTTKNNDWMNIIIVLIILLTCTRKKYND